MIYLDPLLSFASQVTVSNETYVITGVMDLSAGTVVMPDNCRLVFSGGKLTNGTIKGVNTRIDNPSNAVIFDDIVLDYDVYNNPNNIISGWLGECRDVWFAYSASSMAHFKIVKSVCAFEVCHFINRTYYIERWERIHLRELGCIINGGGATFIITGSKGSTEPGWHNLSQYVVSSLFVKDELSSAAPGFGTVVSSGCFSVSDLTILDNNTIPELPNGWGEDFEAFNTTFIFYKIFSGSGVRTTFRNVTYDGCGCLWADYNHRVSIEEVKITGCDIRSAQFALELGNVCRADLPADPGGECKRFLIKDSRFYNYASNVLVGPLSIVNQDDHVESTITKELIIEDSYFESEKVKNLEVSGCRVVNIRTSVFMSVFCSSEFSYYYPVENREGRTEVSGLPINKEFNVIGNFFGISENLQVQLNHVRKISAGDIRFINNLVMVDFTPARYTGGFRIFGYGNNLAHISGNTFVIKGTNNDSFKSMIYYDGVIMDLIGNTYTFLDGVRQGHEVCVAGDGNFINLEVEDDSRFHNDKGGGFSDWKSIPLAQRTSEGFIQLSSTVPLTIPSSFPSSFSSFEFDLKVHPNGAGKDGEQNFLSFSAGSIQEGGHTYNRTVSFQTYYGTFRAVIALEEGGVVQKQFFSSQAGVRLALPFFDLDTFGDSLGIIRIVLINEMVNDALITRVILYIKDIQVDTFLFDQNVLNQGLSSLQLIGVPYLKIKFYRLRHYVKVVSDPAVKPNLTLDPNVG